MPLHAFRLRAEYEGLDPDTLITLPTGADFQVGQAFQNAKDGILVLDDENPEQAHQAEALANYFAVKTASVPEPARKKSAGKKTDTDTAASEG